MQDMVIKGTGNSRFLKSVENFKELYPDYNSFVAALVAGTLPVDFNGINPEGITQMGTPYSKSEVLDDDTAALFGLGKTAVLKNVLRKAGKVVSGSYVGTGTYGEDNPNTLEFTFAPKIVLLIHMVNEDSATPHPVIDRLISPLEYGTVCAGSGIQWYTAAAWGEDGLSVSWWVVGAVGTAAASGPSYQRNHEGKIYHYIAIG